MEGLGVEVPAWVVGVGLALVLILRGVLTRTKDCDDKVTAARVAEQEKAAIAAAAAEQRLADQRATFEHRLRDMQERVARVEADRDAWREAFNASEDGRRASEHAAAKLLDSGNLTLALLDALRAQTERRPA